ncbi:MAG: bifunctional folylpolyglutamate synthase/dihydrofolate synthase, partial [Clostridiaceae bacterium]|nr:bifunctional folylpolyglutamate synthase/dihydrofolate synthase [Clostridiaceae bacterium]
NIQGIKALRRNVEKYFKYKNVYLLLGILADKQVHEMIEVITPFAKKVITLTPMSNRAELAEDLMKEVKEYNKNCISMDNYEEAYKVTLKEACQDDLILISGSLYMIGDMRKVIRKLNK